MYLPRVSLVALLLALVVNLPTPVSAWKGTLESTEYTDGACTTAVAGDSTKTYTTITKLSATCICT